LGHHKARCLSTLYARQRYLRLTVGGGQRIIVQGDNSADPRATVGTKDGLLRCGRGPNTSLPSRHGSGQRASADGRDGRTEVGGSGEGPGARAEIRLGRPCFELPISESRSEEDPPAAWPPGGAWTTAVVPGPFGVSFRYRALAEPPYWLLGVFDLSTEITRCSPANHNEANNSNPPAGGAMLRCCAAVAFLACPFSLLFSPLPDILSFNHPHPRAFPSFTRPASLSISRFTLVVAHYSPRSLLTSSQPVCRFNRSSFAIQTTYHSRINPVKYSYRDTSDVYSLPSFG
jgi:hypothetical protein